MKAPLSWAVLLLCLVGIQGSGVAQKTPVQQTVAVVVADAHTDPAQPVSLVRVSISYLDGSVLVTEARSVTNPRGQAWLDVSEDAAQRGDLRIEITGANNLVIYQPADGQVTVPPTAFTVKLLPKGSPLLLGPAQIEAMLTRVSKQSGSQQELIAELAKENAGLKKQLTAAQAEAQARQRDLSAQMDAWAAANGFTPEQANASVTQWALDNKDKQEALSAFALKNYGQAGKSFKSVADAAREGRAKALQAALAQNRDWLRTELESSEQSAKSFQLAAQYHQAAQVLQEARDDAAQAHKQFPAEDGIQAIWLQAVGDEASALWQEGEVSPADQSLPLLAQAVEQDQSLARAYAALGDRKDSAAAMSNVGAALWDEGERATGDQAMAFLDQAVQAYKDALEVRTKADLPYAWAVTQDGLGLALWDEAQRSDGDKVFALLDQAVQAYRNALEVLSKSEQPEDWAGTQANLGVALDEEGRRATGDKALALLDQAAQACRNALEVETKADLPQEWARTQANLGNTLVDEGRRAAGDKAMALFDQAVQALQHALEVYTEADMPQYWASTENNLGFALVSEGQSTKGNKALALFNQAVDAYRNALEVRTKSGLPQAWASTQMNLASALKNEAGRTAGDQAIGLLDQAVQAYQHAIEVETKADLPQAWAMTENNLGNALLAEGERAKGDKAMALFNQAIQAYQQALAVRTRGDLPQAWAMTQGNLGNALEDEGEQASGERATALLNQAVQAYQNALQIFTRSGLPNDWARVQTALEVLYHDQTFQFADALNIAKELTDFDSSIDNRMNLLEAELTGAEFDECVQLAAKLDDKALAQQKMYTSARDVIGLACQWGAADKAGALATDRRLLAKSDADRFLIPGSLTFTGTLHFLSQSPDFASGRPSWIALFQSLQDSDGAAMTGAMRQLGEAMQH